MRRIHRLSGGVPRLINILCDRALLGAYATQRHQVSAHIVGRASRELAVTTAGRKNFPRLSPLQIAGTLSILLLGVVGLVVSSWNVATDTPPRLSVQSIDSSPEPGIEAPLREPDATIMSVQPLSAAAVEEQVDSAPAARTPTDIETLGIYQRTALARLFGHWGIEFPALAVEDPCGFANARGLRCLKGQGSWSILRKYDRPALLQVHLNEDTSTFVVISGLDESQVVLDLETTRTELPLTALDPTTFGKFMLLWKPPGKDVRIIGEGAHPESILWLRSALARASGSSITDQTNPVYDPGLRDQVMKFQSSRGLEEDGIVGPETLIQLNTALKDPEIPTLSWARDG